MTPEKNKLIHRIYSIVLSIVTVLTGLGFIVNCWDIYCTGVREDAAQIFTREKIAAHFAPMSPLVYACLILVIGGMILNLALPREKKKLAPEKNLPMLLRRLQRKTDLNACEDSLRKDILQQRAQRKAVVLMSTVLFGIGCVFFLVYACNSQNWGSDSTVSMIPAMYMMLASLTVPFLFTVYATFFCRKSLAVEIELMRKASKQAPAAEANMPEKGGKSRLAMVQMVVFAIGLVLVIVGACNEGTKDILTKAVNICTECVGLG